jgi:hypothetical protein
MDRLVITIHPRPPTKVCCVVNAVLPPRVTAIWRRFSASLKAPVDAQGVDGIRRLSPACRDSPPNRPAVSVLVRLKRRAKVGPKVGPAKRIDMKS